MSVSIILYGRFPFVRGAVHVSNYLARRDVYRVTTLSLNDSNILHLWGGRGSVWLNTIISAIIVVTCTSWELIKL